MMDIMELSQNVEGGVLASQMNSSSCKKPLSGNNCSPRLTRSQAIINKNIITDHPLTDLKSRRPLNKVDEFERIYLNKKPKVVHKNLETIYENPVWKKGNTMLLGTSKIKRSLHLHREFRIKSKVKSKLRKMKIKKLGEKLTLCKMTDEEFKQKLLRIENYIDGNDVNLVLEDCIFKCDDDRNENVSGNQFEMSNNIEGQVMFENGDDIESNGKEEIHESDESIKTANPVISE